MEQPQINGGSLSQYLSIIIRNV